jgi:hypothetical protein
MIDAGRLGKLLLMLSSDQPGEVVAAAQAIKRALKADGADWHDLANRLTTKPKPHKAPHRDAHHTGWHDDWHVMHAFCLDRDRLLRPREQEFISSLCDWRGKLTEKQHAWLLAIYRRLGGT